MKFASSNQMKLFLKQSAPTAKRTRSHSKDKIDEDTSNYVILDKLDRHPDNIPPQVYPGNDKKNTNQNDIKYHERYVDSINLFCKVHNAPDWIPTCKTEKRTKGVFVCRDPWFSSCFPEDTRGA